MSTPAQRGTRVKISHETKNDVRRGRELQQNQLSRQLSLLMRWPRNRPTPRKEAVLRARKDSSENRVSIVKTNSGVAESGCVLSSPLP
jgi:hypothetical protein